jgi:hypothetical protein
MQILKVLRLPFLLAVLLWPQPLAAAGASPFESIRPRRPREAPTSPSLFTLRPDVRYTAAQIEAVLSRARNAWRNYLQLRPQLRTIDSREQAFAQKAAALRAMTRAVERLLANEKQSPTKEGVQTVADALTSLDHATIAVEYDCDRISLRIAQESLLPPDQPFCVCLAPAFARISPVGPTACPPATEIAISLAAGEAESFQLVIVPYWQRLNGVRIEVGDLFRRDSIDRFRPDQIRLWLAESVATTPTLGRTQFWADPLSPLRPFDLPATVSQTILVDIRARKEQPAGLYEGHLTIRPENARPTSITLQIVVRSFALPEGVPEVAFRAKNESVQAQLAASPLSRFAREWQVFLAGRGLGLYRQSGPGDPAAGWLPWLSEQALPSSETPTGDPKLPALVSCLAYRQAAWAAWNEQHRRDSGVRRWIVNGWVSLDLSTSEPAKRSTGPLVRNQWTGKASDNPPGLIYMNSRGEPEPTIRLIALRDGIEDFRYFDLLARKIAEAKDRNAAGWWKQRRWKRLLNLGSKLGDPKQASLDIAVKMLERREAVAKAIEQAQRCLEAEGNRKK